MLLATAVRNVLWSIACLVVTVSPVTAATLLSPGHTWEYTFTDPTADLTWNTTTGGWTTGPAPFGNVSCCLDPLFNFNTPWAADGTIPDGDDLWVRTSIDLTGIDLSTVLWGLGVDNGFKLYANGTLLASAFAEGYTFRWEYTGGFGTALSSGVNVIAVALEDRGGATAFDMEVTGSPVPEPSTALLLGSGLAGLAALRRRSGQSWRRKKN